MHPVHDIEVPADIADVRPDGDRDPARLAPQVRGRQADRAAAPRSRAVQRGALSGELRLHPAHARRRRRSARHPRAHAGAGRAADDRARAAARRAAHGRRQGRRRQDRRRVHRRSGVLALHDARAAAAAHHEASSIGSSATTRCSRSKRRRGRVDFTAATSALEIIAAVARRVRRAAKAASYAFALGRSLTRLCHAARFGCVAASMRMSQTLPKSIAHSAVMSATVNRSPARYGPLARARPRASRSARATCSRMISRELGRLLDPAVPERVGVAEHLRDRQQQLELGVAVPHLDLRALPRVGAEQVRLGVQLLDVAADRHRLAQDAAVGELEHRQQRERVLAAGTPSVWCAALRDQDLDRVVRHALLGQEDANPARVGCAGVVVQQHAATVRPKIGMRRRISYNRAVCASWGCWLVLCLVRRLARLQEQGRRRARRPIRRRSRRSRSWSRGATSCSRRARSCRRERDKLDVEIKDIQAKGGDAERADQEEAPSSTPSSRSQNDRAHLASSTASSTRSRQAATRPRTSRRARPRSRSASARVAEREAQDRRARACAGPARRRVGAALEGDAAARSARRSIIQQAAPKGGKYTNKDVTALIQKAKAGDGARRA